MRMKIFENGLQLGFGVFFDAAACDDVVFGVVEDEVLAWCWGELWHVELDG